MKKLTLGLFLLTTVVLFAGCEDEDANKLAQAQACLDGLTDSDAQSKAPSCRQHIAGMTSQQAKILSCSIEFMVGGLTTSRLADAFSQLAENSSANKEAIFISVLAVNSTTQAETISSECNASQIESLIYIAGLTKTGTYIANAAGGLLADINNGTIPTEGQIQTAIANCSGTSQAAIDCQTALGESSGSIATSYCDSNEDDEICQDINAAVAAGATSEAIGAQLLTLLNQ